MLSSSFFSPKHSYAGMVWLRVATHRTRRFFGGDDVETGVPAASHSHLSPLVSLASRFLTGSLFPGVG